MYPQADGPYLLRYAYADKLLADPDDRDALLSIGAFYESLALAVHLEGKQAVFEAGVVRQSDGLQLGRVRVVPLPEEAAPDPLSAFLSLRQTNRHLYDSTSLSPQLKRDLLQLGCTLLTAQEVAPLVSKASVMAWRDQRFRALDN